MTNTVDDVALKMQEAISVAQAIIAAGGADRNRGNAEKLRRYWT